MIYAQLVAGFIYLLGGGDLLVRGGVALARRTRVPPVAVALSVVAFGTSLPEFMVSVRASLTGYPNLVLGNVVGSNTANVLLVGGAAAAAHPLLLGDRSLRRPGVIMFAVAVLFYVLCLGAGVTRLEGGVLLVGLLVVLALTAGQTIRAYQSQDDDTTPLDWALGMPIQLPTILAFIVIGIVTLPLGADLLVEAAVEIAGRIGVSETVVGLSVVAIGTSLPEVVTSMLAALRGRPGMAMGTIIGSNTFNILAIMGVAAAVSPGTVPVSDRFLVLDLGAMLVTSAGLVALAWFAARIERWAGVLALGAYVLYLGALYLTV